MKTVPVVIVGAGPTGLTAATILGQYGVECVVLERWEEVYPLPRAVHLDDEIHRLLARLGVRDEFAAVSRPALGLRLIDRERRVLAEFRREAVPGRHGFPEANMFDQPDLEAILRANLKRFESVTPRAPAEVVGIRQEDVVLVEVVDRLTGDRETIRAEYVLGCDGANSLVRSAIGATMRDLGFAQRWLVVDVDTEAELSRWEGVQQICDRHRAATYMRVGTNRYRWEFQLSTNETVNDFRHETADGFRPSARLLALIAPWTSHVPAEQLRLIRIAEYTFRAQLADRWRDRRLFLLGDAAHLTPPFIGQGMGAGLRDAANLAWKLAAVLAGDLPERVLASYETERRPHARTLVRLARLTGIAMTGGGVVGEVVRRAIAPRLQLVPGLQDRVLNSETPRLSCSELVRGRGLAGRMCPNAIVGDGVRLDDLAAGRFVLVTRREPSGEDRAELRDRDVVLLPVRPGDELHSWLRRGRAFAALVRPDGTVVRSGRRVGVVLRSVERPSTV
ncbi:MULTISPECIES: bifunctional 3-(3-hydroxy-phenyl)propionate/3-hydroxycinnamic acid hydroxylase MhpA [unclassified Kribbella]|uniref:bifunctional 3-(3-hydroxy-phenyl)propionate/3-hydroxycinnamic acid hydroxylase MhpA n=1 Tax=unclassified Kribbella TaxID=2644121 RepID=UPI00301ABDA5